MHLNLSSPLKAEMAEVLLASEPLRQPAHLACLGVRKEMPSEGRGNLGMTTGTLWALVHSPAVS